MISTQVLVGCPENFDLSESLRGAASVKIAMAFAKKSGWTLIKEPLLGTVNQVEIIVGLNFGITDSELLQDWLSLCRKRPKSFMVRVALLSPVFHPKVTIVRRKDGSAFAVVGSGNLTAGGQASNVECGALVSAIAEIERLEKWFANLKSARLKQSVIDEYRPFNARAKEVGVKPTTRLSELLSELGSGWYSELFLKDFSDFLSIPRGKAALKARVNGAKQIQMSLKIPDLSFSKTDWQEFYRITAFGRIRKAYPGMEDSVPALRKAFRSLLKRELDSERFKQVFERRGKHHVHGLGINQISKVLTVHNRRKWPLLNDPVGTTLRKYGYCVQWSAEGYLKFAAEMRDCLKRTGVVDFWALDAFCNARAKDL